MRVEGGAEEGTIALLHGAEAGGGVGRRSAAPGPAGCWAPLAVHKSARQREGVLGRKRKHTQGLRQSRSTHPADECRRRYALVRGWRNDESSLCQSRRPGASSSSAGGEGKAADSAAAAGAAAAPLVHPSAGWPAAASFASSCCCCCSAGPAASGCSQRSSKSVGRKSFRCGSAMSAEGAAAAQLQQGLGRQQMGSICSRPWSRTV